ncbi:thioesterase family protein [Steroidobacter sp.]|uniref:thioesterase family protein n=1 Tax=Steroidobacter sp. TaxID=1978227 RepID=UPI001A5E1D9B|nr:thioesterase family protein [Steroidobacter sp.]MBL8268515.1 thioesterase family protein [Steroidobacter sp.]
MSYVYQVEGSIAHAQPCSAGPWDPGLQHGGAPASLIAWAVERMPVREPMQVVRMTFDLLRPIPVAPLAIKIDVQREGRKIQVLNVTLLHEGVACVRATVLKMRQAELELPEHVIDEQILLPGPEQGRESKIRFSSYEQFASGVTLRSVRGEFGKLGPGALWFHAHRPIIAGEAITPLMRAAMTGDFCNGVSAVLDFAEWTFINADLTISLARQPVGEWILLDAQTWIGERGAGLAFAKLGDERGYFGRAIQSLVIERRAK